MGESSALHALLSLFHPLGRVLLSDKQWLDPGSTERDESAGQYHSHLQGAQEAAKLDTSPGSGREGEKEVRWCQGSLTQNGTTCLSLLDIHVSTFYKYRHKGMDILN